MQIDGIPFSGFPEIPWHCSGILTVNGFALHFVLSLFIGMFSYSLWIH